MAADDEAVFLLQTFAATIVQAGVRRYLARKHFLTKRRAAACVQRCWRRHAWHEAFINRAANRIQAKWRSHSQRRVFRFYRDLVQIREGSSPIELLRCINPREASLIDVASRMHLRFRLGGSSFPPTILYKIFTHAPIADICSFGPRNYAAEEGHLFTQGHRRPQDMAGWYRRWENNGWRPVSERLFVDPDSAASDQRLHWAHFCPKMRRQQKHLAAKQRKRLWMATVYRQAVGQQTSEFDESSGLEQNVDTELLRWTSLLDFESYSRQWTTMAVSSTSEAVCVTAGDNWKSALQAVDSHNVATPCSLSIPFSSGATAAAGSTTGLLSY